VHLNRRGEPIIISRFHWHVATIWTDPVLVDERPNCCFSPLVHTPLVESESYEYRYVEIQPLPLTERIEIVNFYLPSFELVLSQRRFDFKTLNGYRDLISNTGPPDKYLMKFEDIRSAIVFGRMIKEDDVPASMAKALWGSS